MFQFNNSEINYKGNTTQNDINENWWRWFPGDKKIMKDMKNDWRYRKEEMKTKRIIAIFAIILLPLLFYYLWGYIQYNRLTKNTKQEDIIVYETEQISLFITYEPPKMSFGSGHKKMYLFSSYHLLLGICTFGEFPMEVKSVNTKDKIIVLKIKEFFHHPDNDYIESWTKKNKRIGSYPIMYEYEL